MRGECASWSRDRHLPTDTLCRVLVTLEADPMHPGQIAASCSPCRSELIAAPRVEEAS